MPTLDEAPILDLGRTPIPGGAPTGVDPADDENYLLVDGEMGKMDRIDAGEPDWFQMEQAATTLLCSKAKDAEMASALSLALFKRHGYAGLAAALGMLTEMVNAFWEGMFPERPRRRKARMEAMTERFTEGGWFRDHPPKPDHFDAIDLCVTRIGELDAALKAKMADDPPDFAKFTRSIREMANQRPKPAAAPPPAPAGGSEAPGATPAATAGGGAGAFAVGEVADKSGAENAILAAATFLRKADPTDPIPYAVVRAVKWGAIALPVTEAAKYQIEPPEASKLDALTHQLANGLWENLLKNSEAAFRSSDPLWLDLQRYTCAAMAGMGPPYEKARQAVMASTAGLVRRLGEGLYDLKFRGGTPLCSGETRMWIESEVAPPQKAGGGSGGGNGKLAESCEKARKLAGAGKLREAIAELNEGLLACAQKRDRLLWRMQIAQLCVDSQKFQLAAPILVECSDEVRRHHIDEWEPTLAAEVAGTLYRCRRALVSLDKQPSPELLGSLQETYSWLCQLDPMAALSVEPPGK